jgi:lysophospholipase L1-like esterase
LLALIINQKTTNDRVSLFNEQLRDMAEVRITANVKIILVDMETGAGLDYENDMKDIFHPNEAGYEKMANLWYRRLVNFLPSP